MVEATQTRRTCPTHGTQCCSKAIVKESTRIGIIAEAAEVPSPSYSNFYQHTKKKKNRSLRKGRQSLEYRYCQPDLGRLEESP